MPFEQWLTREGSWRADDLAEYFDAREHWQLDAGWATYRQPDSEVELALIWAPPPDRDAVAWAGGRRLMVRVNVLRPAYFGELAGEELERFVEAFAARHERGQAWSRMEFEEQWSALNRAAFEHLDERPAELFAYPGEALAQIGRWNHRRSWLASLVPHLFVPRIRFVEEHGEARSAVVWTELVPASIPVVDRVFVMRSGGDSPGLVELAPALLEAHCMPAAKTPNIPRAQRIVRESVPALERAVESAARVEPRGIPLLQVVDAELLDLAGPAHGPS